ncbi:hypothetical protein FUA48_16295 [Flavobacterium alkalisoli]|uniref:DoxX family membrane protein n=1 Tax=Flavobacterium alkalisoli TaxID=2602769 RepID=A0A5B9G1X7_9FLAO|nr:hypothetical protein [Flavobacterium alkalisoli]QEE51077.1 hypothetical protein FUA48_16295 [Flavobacterium alkalisoli]
MDVVIVLSVFFVLSALYFKLVKKTYKWKVSGNIAMCAMLMFTAIGHFLFTKGMGMMLPPFIPYKEFVVYLTGVMEIAFGLLLLFPKYRKRTGIILIIFFILILPSNIYAALHHVNLKTADFSGNGPVYLWFRIPLQLFFICWVYLFSIKK